MARPRMDIAGQRFGRWTVLEFAESDKHRNSRWLCQCDCGSRAVVHGTNLLSGHSTSCGCYQKSLCVTHPMSRKHGETLNGCESKEYRAWAGMKKRCYNAKNIRYEHYGGRGIKVCDRWLHSFENFLADVGRAPEDSCKWSIDRIDNDGDYDRGNVRWATAKEQANNRSSCKKKEKMAA